LDLIRPFHQKYVDWPDLQGDEWVPDFESDAGTPARLLAHNLKACFKGHRVHWLQDGDLPLFGQRFLDVATQEGTPVETLTS
jgi:hypothetical protein